MFSIFIVLIGYCLCLKPYRLELLGLGLTIAGVACMLNDVHAERTDGKVATFWHYAICISGAFGAAFFMLVNGLLVKELPIFSLLLAQALLGYLYLNILMSVIYAGDFKFFSLDREWGGFGFAHEDEAFVAFACYGTSAGFFGNAGYVICLIFFSPVIVSASFLAEPFLGQMIGFAMNIDRFPGWLTWVGTALVLFGVLGIQKADRERKNAQAAKNDAEKEQQIELASAAIKDQKEVQPAEINFDLPEKTKLEIESPEIKKEL